MLLPKSVRLIEQGETACNSRRLPSRSTARAGSSGVQPKHAMRPYRNLNGNSGVVAYEVGADFIRVTFNTAGVYRYTDANSGRRNVEEMKGLAFAGVGLATFINAHVDELYPSLEE